ncbi:hypothetical protein MPSEU_000150300 [Mayamaea pseudoterrestris]|nr:hypothetical protein MPSEU_000150300 [Mayamaea pseudoterrestris]
MATRRRSSRGSSLDAERTIDIDDRENSIEADDEVKEEELDEPEEGSPNDSRRRSTRNRSKVLARLPPDSESEDEEQEDANDSDDDGDDAPELINKNRRTAPNKLKILSDKQEKTKQKASHRGSPLAALAKKCLFDGEDDENSLLAALLHSKDISSLAASVLQDYKKDSNAMRIQLLNLLFRSVGSTPAACLDAEEIQIDDLGDDEWLSTMTFVFEQMQTVPLAKVLLHLDPTKNKSFREAYQDFFYQLIMAALDDNDGISAEQINSVKAIVGVLLILVAVGQPDMRLGASMAVYSMSKAILQTTKALNSKIDTAKRHLQIAKRNKSRVKANTLSEEIASWSEASDDLLETVVETVMSSVFAKRVRDSDPHLRILSLETLRDFCLIRPDSFIAGRFLKYFGWFAHDKDADVRYAALHGLFVPLKAMKDKMIEFDKGPVTHVLGRFLSQITKLVFDVSITNQELALELILLLLREEYLDNLDDAVTWIQINSRALAENTSPAARKTALCFVMAQCEPFDDDQNVDVYTEKRAIDQIGALAAWAASMLAKGDVPLDQVRYELVDYMVHSLMSLAEHRSLATNWSALLKALQSEDQTGGNHRVSTVKQRIIMRMLVTAAELESFIGSVQTFDKSGDIDPALIELEKERIKHFVLLKTKPDMKSQSSHQDNFGDVLATSLHQLLVRFKGDTHILRQLTRLPRHFSVDVFNMPTQKKNYTEVIQDISTLFLELTDTEILGNCAFVLTAFARASHSRAGEALLQLARIACTLRDRMLELITKKRELSGKAKASELCDVENSKGLCLRRLAILSKRWDVAELLGDGSSEDGDAAIRRLWKHVSKDLELDLALRIVKWERNEEEEVGSMPQHSQPVLSDTWGFEDSRLHSFVADNVENGLVFFYLTMVWQFKKLLDQITSEDEGETEDEQSGGHVLIYMRDELVKLILLCFEQDLQVEVHDEGTFSEDHVSFATNVMMAAHGLAGDLFLLFPPWMHDAKSLLLRTLASGSDQMIRGVMARFVESMDELFQSSADAEKEDMGFARSLLMPLARCASVDLLGKTKSRSSGKLLQYCMGYGDTAGAIAGELNKLGKKLNPHLCVENQYMVLQKDFLNWCRAEPIDPGDMPSEKESEDHEAAVHGHAAMMHTFVAKAMRMASVFGVGNISDDVLSKIVCELVMTGLPSAFSGDKVGARLPFLRPVSKYLVRLKGNTAALKCIEEELNDLETKLRETLAYEDLPKYDVESIEEFRKAGGFRAFPSKRHARAKERAVDSVATTTQNSNGSVASNSSSCILSSVSENGDEEKEDNDVQSSDKRRQSSSPRHNSKPLSDDNSTASLLSGDGMISNDEDSQSGAKVRKRSNEAAQYLSSKRAKSGSLAPSLDAQTTRTLRGTRLSTVNSPLSSTPSSVAADSVFDRSDGLPTMTGKRRQHGSFGGQRKSSSTMAESVALRPSRPSRSNKLGELSQSTIQHEDSGCDSNED